MVDPSVGVRGVEDASHQPGGCHLFSEFEILQETAKKMEDQDFTHLRRKHCESSRNNGHEKME